MVSGNTLDYITEILVADLKIFLTLFIQRNLQCAFHAIS